MGVLLDSRVIPGHLLVSSLQTLGLKAVENVSQTYDLQPFQLWNLFKSLSVTVKTWRKIGQCCHPTAIQ